MLKAVESACAGQPDKVCDQVADALVDEFVRRDPASSVDLSVLGSHGMLMVAGEVDSRADFDLASLAKKAYAEAGYADEVEVFVNVEKPSDEMKGAPRGATDTRVVRGYATRETREMLPRPVVYAHAMTRRLDELRRLDPLFGWLKSDGKAQVVMDGDRVHAVTVLASHGAGISPREVKRALIERVIVPVMGEEPPAIHVNPLGAFVTDGFHADSGMSGRHAESDAYGALVPFGTALSGRDPYKRAGAYLARHAARSIVAQGLAQAVTVTVAYTMGRAEPILVEVRGVLEKSRGAKLDLTEVTRREYDFRPEAAVERLSLARPLYRAASLYGQFGRGGFPWEE
ncbi:hypothetical protein A2856_03235 [Candidatus Uhrbacteria bacterium RIFCSPHIGHO2_01_FULL_63_20]|uniref:Methionine adenosyltransferase n=1 Tax=Candidatus Uhrbacteria bacterium RIFCSPHIGHO2_01_FULL_63_20 TaxID=1802385 RepID=A0A1F7TL70_9BACT|nr:MAG: hypothetical protein A2856_03235 [Candidatus Uhrbacteria bacterium RIFCSPHIGHO2_01_FULL_63_20]